MRRIDIISQSHVLETLERRRLLAAIDVLTQHNDNSRTSDNLSETVLNTTNINQSVFGRLYARAVDDQIYAQPLYVVGVNIPGKGIRNVVYVATVNDSVYAFDADDATAPAFWKTSYIDLANNIRPVFHTDVGQACGNYVDFSGNIGIVSTPVIDKATGTMYLVARTVEGTGANQKFVQRLHAVDITTGAEKLGGPITITASVPGTGAGSSGGVVPFNPQTENQRAALALYNGKVFIAWASHCDTGPYHGWVMAYSAANLSQVWAINITANGSNGGIWQSGNGPVIDTAGNIYYTVGNGTVNPTGGQYGEAMLRISSTTGQILDYFIPNDYQTLENSDIDFGSAGGMLVPGSRTIITGSKEGEIFLLNADNLGHLNTPDQSLQEFQVGPNFGSDKIHGTPVYYKDSNNNQWVYVWASNDKLKQFQFNPATGIFTSTTPVRQSNVTVNPNPSMPGGVMAVSSNGQTAGSGILWATTVLSGNANNDVRPGILRAFDATDVSVELWNTQQNALRDDFGNLAKFNTPTVDNGKVYLPTFSNQLVVYGLLAGIPAAPTSLTATVAANGVDINLSWPAVSGALQYTIERRSGSSGNFIPVVTLDNTQTTYSDQGLSPGTMYTYRVRAQNTIGASTPAEASATTTLIKQLAARYKFDENGGTTAGDSSGNNNTAALASGVTWTTGRFASGLNFDGTANAYLTVPNSASLNPGVQMSVVAWINATSWAGGNHRVLQKGSSDNQYRLTDETDVLKWHIANVGTVQTTLPSTGVWHLIVGTYNGSNLTLYIDGAQAATLAATGTIPITTDQLVIGSKNPTSTAGDHFSGKMDEVRIYNYALTAAEVTTLNIGLAPAAPTGLLLSAPSPSNIAIQWNDVANNEAGYLVDRRPAAGGAYAQVASVPANTNGYNDTGLPAFTTFFYRVRAYNIFDFSSYTPEQSVTTQGAAIHSLVGRFPLDESAGTTVADASGHGIVASLIGAPTHPTDTADASTHSLGLNGSTDWAQAPDNAALDMTDGLTLAAWVKADTWSQTRPILQKGGRETHYVLEADEGVLKFDLTLQGTLTAPLPSTGVWHHVAATYDGATMKIYVDGLLAGSRAASGAMDTTPEPFFIGGSHASASTGLAFAGKIDDARVYNYALNPVDVSAIYGNVAQLKFDEGFGTAANDTTPNNNNGMLVNAPTWAYSRDGFALGFSPGKYVLLNDNQTLNPAAAFSAAAWFNATSFSGTPTILQKGTSQVQYRLFASGGNLTFEMPGVGFVSAPVPTLNAWHFVAGTYNGTVIKLYVDGVAVAGAAASAPLLVTSNQLVIGAADQTGAATKTFAGLIDNVRLFSRGLTADEVQAIYTAPTVDLTPPTVSSANYVYQASPNALTISFSEAIASSLDAISITNLTTSAALSPTSYSFNPATNVATFTLPAGALADGNYRATLDASKVKDSSNNAMTANFVFDFFSLAGDANHDRTVELSDFAILAANFNHSGATFQTGDFNYDGQTNLTDFTILAANFNKMLAPPPAPPPAPVAGIVSRTDDSLDLDCGCGCGDWA